jgi:alpha-2-macroglobulin
MKRFHKMVLLLIFVVSVFSCSERKPATSTDPALFEPYIAAHTTGSIPANAVIQIHLRKPVSGFQSGSQLPEGTVRLSPSVKGKSFLIDLFTIEFRPDEALQSGQNYEVVFNLSKLFEVEKNIDDFNFSIAVIQQDFSVFQGRLISDFDDNKVTKRYEGKLITADDMSLAEVVKLLDVASPVGKMTVEVSQNGPREFDYFIKNIERMEKSYPITLSWDGSPVGIGRRGSFDIQVPSSGEFSLLEVKLNRETLPNSVRLIFSDPPDKTQDLDGLIRIINLTDFRISVQGNEVTLFPQTQPDGTITVMVEPSLQSNKGIVLGKRQEYLLALEALKPQVAFVGSGNILPDSRDLSLAFKAVSLRAVDVVVYKVFSDNVMQFFQNNNFSGNYNLRDVARPVYRNSIRLDENPATDLTQWNTWNIDLTGMINNQPNAIYRVKLMFNPAYAVADCNNFSDDIEALSDGKNLFFDQQEKDWFDGFQNYYYYFPDNYNWQERDNPCSESYYTPDKFAEHNVLATNLGLIAKSSDNKTFSVTATDLLTAAPIPSATVEFYNFQKQLVGSSITDGDGLAKISLNDIPYILLAKKGNDKTWLRLDNGSSLSVSNFDVSGSKISSGIKGMIYGERGIWRPGDTLFITFLMDHNNLPEKHPVVFELYNSRGQKTFSEVKTKGLNGFYTFKPVTSPDAPTGNWIAKVLVGGASFEKLLKVETLMPNRLKMDLRFNKNILSANDNSQTGRLKVNWLHGADADGLRSTVDLKLVETSHSFQGFEKYSFSDPSKYYLPYDMTVFDDNLNSDGSATIALPMKVNTDAPGMLSAVFTTRVFENGGSFSSDFFTIPFSPYQSFTGVKMFTEPNAQTPYSTDTSQIIEVVTLDKNGNPVSRKNLEAIIYKLSWYWWWGAENDNLARWINGEDAEIVFRKNFSTAGGAAKLSFRVDYPDWGNYFIRVIDHEGGHSSGLRVFFDWPETVSRAGRLNPSAATVLAISADKEKYAPGDIAKIIFPAADASRALISLENGSSVIKQKWVNGHAGENIVEIEITPQMAPNIYAHVTLIQPHAQSINDLPIRLYGIVPLVVENPATRLTPEIIVPSQVNPESAWTMKVSEKNGLPMTYTIAVVDEGLLDLTKYSTPDPWAVFYAREALGIKTWDLFDDVLGAYGGILQKALAIGGDRTIDTPEVRKAKRFKPVVQFLGPFNLQKNQTATHQLLMPAYIGSVKTMVIAGHQNAWGNAQATIPVKQPLMILPTAPRLIGVGETFDLPVTIFAMDEKVKKVTVRLSTEGLLSNLGENQQEVLFDKSGEQTVYFTLKAKENEGFAKMNISAKSGNETARASVEISVNNSAPDITRTETLIVDPGGSADFSFGLVGIESPDGGSLEISGLPVVNFEKNLRFLLKYPYGCLEQITSAALAQLYLDNVSELDDQQQQKITSNIRKAIQKLTAFQLADGSLSYWPGRTEASPWGAAYAAHFIALAEKEGFLVPAIFKKQLFDRLFQQASAYHTDAQNQHYNLVQAYRLYTCFRQCNTLIIFGNNFD